MNLIEKQLLVNFLKKQGVYPEFRRNVLKSNRKYSFNKYLLASDFKYIIGESFIWEHTPEGQTFWENVEDKWVYYLDYLEQKGKEFRTQNNIGRAKYTISTHNGIDTHKDGSKFFGIEIFSNKKKFEARQKELLAERYTQIN